MPAHKLNGNPLIYYAGYKKHIGVYALPNAHAHFQQELAGFKQGKGSIQFLIQEPLPYELILRMVRFNIDSCRN